MSMPDELIAEAVLGVHVMVIGFNVAGLIVIPLGGWLGWRMVRVGWLRLLHLAMLGVVAGQAIAGRACFLTVWQNELSGGGAVAEPLIMRLVDGVIYWNLPIWVFAVFYSLVFLYVLGLTVMVPFGRRFLAVGR
jgi:hypothetical protein